MLYLCPKIHLPYTQLHISVSSYIYFHMVIFFTQSPHSYIHSHFCTQPHLSYLSHHSLHFTFFTFSNIFLRIHIHTHFSHISLIFPHTSFLFLLTTFRTNIITYFKDMQLFLKRIRSNRVKVIKQFLSGKRGLAEESVSNVIM